MLNLLTVPSQSHAEARVNELHSQLTKCSTKGVQNGKLRKSLSYVDHHLRMGSARRHCIRKPCKTIRFRSCDVSKALSTVGAAAVDKELTASRQSKHLPDLHSEVLVQFRLFEAQGCQLPGLAYAIRADRRARSRLFLRPAQRCEHQVLLTLTDQSRLTAIMFMCRGVIYSSPSQIHSHHMYSFSPFAEASDYDP